MGFVLIPDHCFLFTFFKLFFLLPIVQDSKEFCHNGFDLILKGLISPYMVRK